MPHARSAPELLTQYAAGHRDQRNIVMQLVGMPLLVFGVSVLLARARFDLAGFETSAAWLAFAAAAGWFLSRRGAWSLSLMATGALAALTGLAHTVPQQGWTGWMVWGLGSLAAGCAAKGLGLCYEGRAAAVSTEPAGHALLVGTLFATAQASFALGWNKPLLAEIERRVGPAYLRDLAHPA